MSRKKLVKPLSYSAFIILLFLTPLFVTGPYLIHILIMCGISVILASSLRLIFNCGELSIATGGMMCVGGYMSALLVMKLGLSTWAALVMGGTAATVLALLVAYPFFRLKGIYFALVTAFLGEVIRLVAEQWRSVTGGTHGISNIPRPDPIIIPGLLNIDFTSKVHFYYLILLLVLLTLLILYAVEHSRAGVTWTSIRESDFLAESTGVNVINYKVLAFCIASFFPGLVGAFYSQYMTVINPSAFGFFFSIYVIVYLVVGGARRFIGPIIGAVILTSVPELARPVKEFQPYIFAGLIMLVLFWLPEGVIGLPKRLRKIIKERWGHA
jgi:branched-chain amino acid transport system permease protein